MSGYIDYISALVVKESIENVRNKLEIKTQFEKKNWLRIALKRKINLMQTFSASIIHSTLPTRQELKSPYTVMVRPLKMIDFSISLGADGIGRKLEIEKAVTDVAELNGELRNRQYLVEQLTKANVDDVKFIPFKYQLSPSLP